MQSSTSTSIHHTQATTLNIQGHHPSSCNADIQDSNTAGRPFSFVPKRRSSSGSMGRKAPSKDISASNSLQQGQIWLVEQSLSDDSATPQTTPHIYSTFPRTRPELPRGPVPEFDGEVDSATIAIQPAIFAEIHTSGSSSPSAPVPAPISTFLIRKKSGELVKPSLKSTGFATWAISSPGRARTKSAPTTPMGSKSVHFDAQLEHVKLFLAEQKPLAVSRDGSPTETSEGETTDTGFPFPRMTSTTLRLKGIIMPSTPPEPWTFDVRLERLALEDTTLVGQVLVRNVAFAKWVAVRFTLDAWQTTSEVAARHIASLHDNSFDRFEFRVRLVDYMNGIESKKIVLCVRFSVVGREMWDSNGGRNYEVRFEKVKDDSIGQAHAPTTSGGKTGLPLMADLRRQLEKVAQDVQAHSPSPPVVTAHRKQPRGLRVWLGDHLLGDEDSHSSPPLRPRSRSPSPLDDQSTPSLSNTDVSLSARYDFGASLRSPNWNPPQVHANPPTPSSTTPRSRNIQRRPKSPPLSPYNSTATFQFPRAAQHRRSLTIPLDDSPTSTAPAISPQESPRVSADWDKGMEEHRRRQDDDMRDEDKPRHHTRGWVRDPLFEQLVVDAATLKKTPPGMPTVIPPTPPQHGPAFHLGNEESSSSSSCSPSVSPSTSQEPLNNVWRALCRDKDEGSVSTPSFTTASSTPTTLSPLSPHGELPRAASETSLTTATAPERNTTQRPPMNSTPYYSFLDQFCFFTGVNPRYNQSHNASDVPRRTQSALTVEEYFSLPTSHGDPSSPLSTINVSTSSSTTRNCSPIPTDFTSSRRLTTSS